MVEALGLRIRVEELCERRVEWALVEKLEPQEPEGSPEEQAGKKEPASAAANP